MKNAKIVFWCIVSVLLFLSACSPKQRDIDQRAGSNQSNEENKTKFGIYLYDSVATTSNGGEKGVISKIPVISEKNIKNYNWNTHEISLNIDEKKVVDFPRQLESGRNNGAGIPIENLQSQLDGGCKTVGGKPNGRFAVFVNGANKYEGVFQAAAVMSYQAEGETIMRDTVGGVKIELFGRDKNVDIRAQKDIYETLKKLGKLIE